MSSRFTGVLGAPAARIAGQGTAVVAGVLLLVAAAVPWSGTGAGSSLALWRIADLILSGAVGSLVPQWTGLAVYLVPLGGALLLVGAGLGGRPGLALCGLAVVAAVGATVLVVAALERLGRTGVGPGTLLAAGGATLGVVSTALAAMSVREDGPRRSPSGPATRPGDQ